ncbi:MAG: hypothetical protein Unbinned96contig1001_51 [Prokaryotic dsDNA virus sp.]|nr:MAG: hypothetical protein Unbinned96contig1001_51 [Prokaryotic dsDNA virus sp.]|tara:strand:- start:37496 stop:39229 length:1734 start_codon:yes stop_codon:yes gene_type:complete
MSRYVKGASPRTVAAIDTELEEIEVAIGDTLSRKGDTPNQMEADLDMNDNALINARRVFTENLTYKGQDFEAFLESITPVGVPTFSNIITPAMFDIVGNGSDETVKIQQMFDAASGKTIYLDDNATYGITLLTIPDDVSLVSYNSQFRKLVANTDYGIYVGNRFKADRLRISSGGGSSDKGIRITGNLVKIGYLSASSDAFDSEWGIHFESTDGSVLGGIEIDKMTTTRYRTGSLIFNVAESQFNKSTTQDYIVGMYCRDVADVQVNGHIARFTSPSSPGTAGNNGLLIESTLSNYSTNNCVFNDIHVEDAGEHGIRLGGNVASSNLTFNNIKVLNSGAAGAGATGGAGFKALMKDETLTFHKNIIVNNLIVEDCSTTGSGLGNFAGVIIGLCDGVSLNNIIVRNKNNAFSCWDGLSLYECKNVNVTNFTALNCRRHGLRLEGGSGAFVSEEMTDINITSSTFQNESTVASSVIECDTLNTLFTRVNIQADVRYGSQAANYDTGTLPTPFVGCNLDITYSDPLSTAGNPPVTNNNIIRLNYRGPWYGAFNMNGSDSSLVQEDLGNVRIRKAGAWVTL